MLNHKRRLKRLRAALRRNSVDAMMISNVVNVRYLTGFTGEDSMALVSQDRAVLITDFRYGEQAARELKRSGVQVVEGRIPLFKRLAREAKALGVGTIGFESDSVSVATHRRLVETVKGATLKGVEGLVEQLRERKERGEIKRIQTAIDIAEEAFKSVRVVLKPGLSERDVAVELEWRMKKLGAEKAAFPIIVAAGAHSSQPHARAGSRKLKAGEPVLVDWGATVAGYNSDLTRLVFLGRIRRRWKERYAAVLQAQRRAISAVRPDVNAAEIDAVARTVLKKHRMGRRFGHGLGHGVGLCIHEGPRVAARSKSAVKAGMVFTVEPGVYYPGWGGIRIEDMVVVTRTGCRVLTTLAKNMKQLSL